MLDMLKYMDFMSIICNCMYNLSVSEDVNSIWDFKNHFNAIT